MSRNAQPSPIRGHALTIDPNNLAGTAKLTFNDDFNSLSLWNGTSGTWTTGDSWGNEKGFTLSGNGEQQWYINSNYAPTQNIQPWSVQDGTLHLTAQPTDDATKAIIGDHAYTSGQVNTFNSFSQTYGYFEMRAELPEGAGLWPAFWLLPENNQWPPEIDVMENLGDNMNKYYTTAHTAQTGQHTMSTTNIATPDLSAGYHNYGVDWEADKITWYFDGKQVFQSDTPTDMHDPMYMVANLAVGGYWPGNPTSASEFPADMKIDYIRAYSDNPNATVFNNTPATTPSTQTTDTTQPQAEASPATQETSTSTTTPVDPVTPTTAPPPTPVVATDAATETAPQTPSASASVEAEPASPTPAAAPVTQPIATNETKFDFSNLTSTQQPTASTSTIDATEISKWEHAEKAHESHGANHHHGHHDFTDHHEWHANAHADHDHHHGHLFA